MYRLLLLLLILFLPLSALDDVKILKRAESLMKSDKKDDCFKAYNDYKNLYLHSVMNGDKKLRLKSLEVIVGCGAKLHIDVTRYSTELENFKSKSSVNSSKKKVTVTSSHILESSEFIDNKLFLTFDKKLEDNQVNYFKIYDAKKKRFRYIFDVHAIMEKTYNKLKYGEINRIVLAQFNSKTIRLVIEDSEKIDISFKKDDNQLVITIKEANKASKEDEVSTTKDVTPKRADRDKTIVIDAGHGGKDPGAVGYKKYREKIVVYKIASHLKTILNSRGYKVYMTRYGDKFVKLKNRTTFANEKEADLFISIHANAVGKKNANDVHGIETYFLSPSRSDRAERVAATENSADLSDMNAYGKQSFLNFLNHHKIVASNKLAIDLQRGMLGALNKKYDNVKDGGVREGPFWVLVGAQMPAVLVEVGFISHPVEAKRLVDDNYRKLMAQGMADGIERY
ncbi:MAG: N-acetylmuramoyl-L-alanine amidase, partial [Campylobacterales bacterium]|nr:N-acetylmuramoyl-L-alanine amidase [Campylobacterales bacterium]